MRPARSTALNWRTGNSSPYAPPHNTLWPRACQLQPCANPQPTIVLEAETTYSQFRNELINLTSRNWPISIHRHWQSITLTAPCQCLHHTHPRCAACAICAARIYNPKIWSNSSSGSSSVSVPARCVHRSWPASAIRFAVWSNSRSGLSQTPLPEQPAAA